MDAMRPVRRSRPEPPDPWMEQLLLCEPVVDRDDEPALKKAREVLVEELPLARDIGELSVGERDAPLGEVVLVPCRRLMLAPVERTVALGDRQLVKMPAPLHQPRKGKGVEQLVAEEEMRAVPRY